MEPGTDRNAAESAIRAIAASAKALRLYPPTSPIPRQSIEDAVVALSSAFAVRPGISLVISRDGFELDHSPLASGGPGVADLAETLRSLGVAELDLLPGCSADDLTTLLGVLDEDPAQVAAAGGLTARLGSTGVEGVRVREVALTVMSAGTAEIGQDAGEFLRELATDGDKLSAWLAAAAAGDPAALREGLGELASAVGGGGHEALAANIAHAFRSQGREVRDALIGCAMEPGPVHELAGAAFTHLDDGELADSLCEGLYGENMLSLSNALTHLPLQQRIEEMRAKVQGALAASGHTEKEVHFLEHMLQVRSSPHPETALAQTETYSAVARALCLDDLDLDHVRADAEETAKRSDAAGVRTMLILLGQHSDLELYARSADSLATMVPRLIATGQIDLATRVVRELVTRSAEESPAAPELGNRLRRAAEAALSEQTVLALVDAASEDRSIIQAGRTLLRLGTGDQGAALLTAALARGQAGVQLAEDLLGDRFEAVLAEALPRLAWSHLRFAVTLLASGDDPSHLSRVEEIASRPDERSRREVAAGLAEAGSPAALPLLARSVCDPDRETAIIAVRAMAKHGAAGAGDLLARRLGEIDLYGEDFLFAREIIGALARIDEPSAETALRDLSSRRALIKRGHFAEVQQLARQALEVKMRGGGSA